jgi:hypothetical protein
MDLNQLPPEFDLDFIDLEAAEPTFFTQKESAVAVWGANDRLLGPCVSNNLDVAAVHSQVGDISNPCDRKYVAPTAVFVEENGLHGIGEGDEHLDDIAEEVWCTPAVPHTGQTFGTQEEAKSYYNAYAKRIGFSIRISATRLSTSSRQQRKVYICVQ